jgi:cyclomaltodextrin glucanotransferase
MIDFRSQTIYYVVIDRFYDGTNTGQTGQNSSDLNWNDYWGGTIKGLTEKLDYLKALGITTIWLSPTFEIIKGLADYECRGSEKFYGYWPQDFKKIEPALLRNSNQSDLQNSKNSEFDLLIKELHKRDMRLIFDIVCNFSSANTENAYKKVSIFDNGKCITSFDKDILNWYHSYDEGKSDWQNVWQLENQPQTGLALFNEHIFTFRAYIKSIFKFWIDRGVDGFFINSVKNMPFWFWQELFCDLRSYKPDIFVFGDWFKGGPNDEGSVQFSNNVSIPMLDYSLQKAIEKCFVRNDSAGFYLIDDVFKRDGKMKSSTELITFADFNNLPRFLSLGGQIEKLELTVTLLLTCRGIPVIYYGTEQYLHHDFNSGRDPYNRPMMSSWDKTTKLFNIIKKLSKLRFENQAIQKGLRQTRYITDNIFVFVRKYGDDYCVIALNKGHEKNFNVAGIDLPDGIYKDVLSDREILVENNKIIHLHLDENDAIVLSRTSSKSIGSTIVTFQLNGYDTHFGEVVKVIGNVSELGNWDINKAPTLQYINSNTWRGDIVIDESPGKTVYYKYVAVDIDKSVKYENRIPRQRILPSSGYTVWKNEWN